MLLHLFYKYIIFNYFGKIIYNFIIINYLIKNINKNVFFLFFYFCLFF